MSVYKNVLVGIDGSKQSKMAFDKAVQVCKQNQSKLFLLCVINGEHYPTAAGYGIVDKHMYDAAQNKMSKSLDELSQKAHDAGVEDVHTEVVVGNAKVVLTEHYPKKHDIDLIVVGATGLNVIGRMIVGSTAAYVVRESPCDVMVVKTDQNNQKVHVDQVSYPEV
ncbi:universal stress protein [Limosilactobacillus secaliphilus]|uniref:Universal stress protein n=1 Tax=Limosilactobacillus secaliphilus TaxID=396268 RepID=A0A0R2I2Q6_9LACO|nr:universal stress protein [Limosilactobacillus secaliphilus]KRN59195.1 UspA domain-containing protein [Limosilactobacillus secaliphilus]